MEKAVTQAISRCEKSVVSIARVRPGVLRDDRLGNFNPFNDGGLRGGESNPETNPNFLPSRYGTGVVIDKGKILTNYHVIDDYFGRDENEIRENVEDRIVVWTHQRRPYRARVLAADPRSDLAVLEIDADLPAIKLGDATKLRKGSFVVALGNPYAIARDGSPSASWGIVANVSRKLDPGPGIDERGDPKRLTLHHFGEMIQTDAKLNFGTSGGALINLKGEMVGLTTSLAALAGYDAAAGYAIPVNDTFRWVIEALKQGKEAEYGFLGVGAANVPSHRREAGERGAYITLVGEQSPAEKAGLEREDIVLEINGKKIYDADDLILHVGMLPVGSKIRMTVFRNGRLVVLQNPAVLSKYPIRGVRVVTNQPSPVRGMQVDHVFANPNINLDRPLPHRKRALEEGCVWVRDVHPSSPAHQAGVRPGMLITRVNGVPVSTPEEFRRAAGKRRSELEVSVSHQREPISIPAE